MTTVNTNLLRDDARNVGIPAVAQRLTLAANEILEGRARITALLVLVRAMDDYHKAFEAERAADDEWRRVSMAYHTGHPTYIKAFADMNQTAAATRVAGLRLDDARNAPELQE